MFFKSLYYSFEFFFIIWSNRMYGIYKLIPIKNSTKEIKENKLPKNK